MPVAYIELENFKSYAGKQRIGPFKDFTSIIGPNGSGKSNLMDAISFVLGVQSRDLRSSQMKDLIFRPPEDQDKQQQQQQQQQLRASATLIYTEASSPESSPQTQTETRFTRIITPKGNSIYKINNSTVTFSEYEQHLASIGVLLKGRNFLVFQGDVESTARKTPKELTAWFEQISNSHEFKQEYEDAYTQMTDADNNARLASQKLKGFWKKKRELKVQKEEAEKFKVMLESKGNMMTEFYLWQLFHLKCDMEDKEEYIAELNDEIKELNKDVAEKTNRLRNAKKDASKARNNANKHEKERLTIAVEVDKMQPSMIKTREEIKNLKKKISVEETKLEKAKEEKRKHAEILEKLTREIKEYTETEHDLQKEFEETKLSNAKNSSGGSSSSDGADGDGDDANTALTEQQEKEYEAIREAAAIASAKPRQALNMVNKKLESARAKSASIQDEVKELKSRHDDAIVRLKDLEERKNNLEKSVKKTSTDLKQAQKDLRTTEKVARDTETKRIEIESELEQINHKLREVRDDRKNNQHEARLEEAIGTLKRYYPGVKDRLVKLCQPTQKRFDLAVTVAGGKDMDAVVVDTKQTAVDCIQHLRTHQIGTATFIPLDSIQIPNPDSTERLRAMVEHDSRYRLTCDVIACDDSIKKAVMYAVGNSVVCDDLDSARKLCFSSDNRRQRSEEARIKAVTTGGAVISKAGTMTGGVTNEERSRAGRWDDREVQKLRQRKEELEAAMAELEKSSMSHTGGDRRLSRGGHNYRIEELRNSVGNLTNRLKYSQQDLEFTTKKLEEQRVLIASISTQVEASETKLVDSESQIESISKKAQQAADDVKKVEEEHFNPFLEKTGMKDFHAYDAMVGKAREEYFKKVGIIRQHLEKLKAQKEYEEERDCDEAINAKEKVLETLKRKLGTAETREAKTMESMAESKAKLADIESKLEQARHDEAENEDKVRAAQKDYKASQQEASKLSKNLNNEEANLERLKAKQHETLQMARVQEAEIPLVDEENVDTSTQLSNKIDYTSLSRDLRQRRGNKDLQKIHKKFESSLEKISSQIEIMAPNMKAGEAFDNVIDQMEGCNEDHSDAKETAQEATRKFNEIKRKRTERFNSAFQQIADSLTTIYKDMTKSSKHPLGGKAYLSLDDSEEPYNGGIKFTAMPPMKRYRDMEYLSGGEKTVAALALLFAIHSYHPAPFFVLDEVDAALDNINVLKLCNYIKQRSKNLQCIVISLKDLFYEQSNGLVGICRDVPSNSSRTLTLDLSRFDKQDDESSAKKASKRRRMSSLGPRKRVSTETVASSVHSPLKSPAKSPPPMESPQD